MAVIRGATRGGGVQLAKYLTTQAENEDIRILDVCGRHHANASQLREALYSMSLTAELTKSGKGIYHAQINPAYGEDAAMTDEDWHKAADILGQELKLDGQRRVLVLHTKKGRTHAHVAWERYDYGKKKMVSDSYSRLAQDRARAAIEQVFEHRRTPQRNADRPDMKRVLSDLWNKFTKGGEFVKAAKHYGYVVAAGIQRRPFMVVDEKGRSFDLVRQLDKVKTKDVRERLKDEKLIAEKDAIELVRRRQKLADRQQADAANDNRKEQTAEKFTQNQQGTTSKENLAGEKKKDRLAAEFAATRDDQTQQTEREAQHGKNVAAAKGFAGARNEMTGKPEQPDKMAQDKANEQAAQGFAANREDAVKPAETAKEKARREFIESLRSIEDGWKKDKDKGRSPG